MNKNNKKSFYLIGIKGVGMTMLAQFLAQKGCQVSGSDVPETFVTDKVLKKEKIKVISGFAISNIPSQVDLIIHSSAFTAENNIEMAELRKRKIKIISYAEAIGSIFNDYYGVAVIGSHGKTTTTAWLGYVLKESGLKPNVLVGSRVPQFNGSSIIGNSKYFIAEADEYQNKLQYFNPQGVLLNNIDYDHPDFFKTRKSYEQVFIDFVKKIPRSGFLVVNYDNESARRVASFCRGKVIYYSLINDLGLLNKIEITKNSKSTNKQNYNLKNLPLEIYHGYYQKTTDACQVFTVFHQGKKIDDFKISLPGKHNISNALAVIASARNLGVKDCLIKKNLPLFKGTEQRLQELGQYKKAVLINDYAHHPTEIKASLEALRSKYKNKYQVGGRLITIFHPHTFSRTKALLNDFVKSFEQSDLVIILDIYGSAREKKGTIHSLDLVKLIEEHNKRSKIQQEVHYLSTLDEVTKALKIIIKSNDVVVLMGAGDVFRIANKLLKK
ncbi:MAG: UDP-N-acetylmuramate--L-alanine ligase [Planctomycetes bacterium]|jgi:UDP-N-acetylmuramate--alanine ligase|nr:UDP-N-acetylmuramate--L-alanine ligase [Planctomycetota bacterium]